MTNQHDNGSAADQRRQQARHWAAATLGIEPPELKTVAGDASFRRYFRFVHGDTSLVLMDAPPDKEDSAPFVDIAGRLADAGLRSPAIVAFDLDVGFGLLEDFGDTLYREMISESSMDELWPGLLETLVTMAGQVGTRGLDRYDSFRLQQELSLMTDWYLRVHRQRELSSSEWLEWNQLCVQLIRSAQEQPQVFVHRDFHSCNLLYLEQEPPGIIDFQDAVVGPISYDLVSLIWDRYIHWPRERLVGWMTDFHARLELDCSPDQWIRWCDLMGLQRNLKIVGIFARLRYRDHRQGYVEMIPGFYRYVMETLGRYPEFRNMHEILEAPECAP